MNKPEENIKSVEDLPEQFAENMEQIQDNLGVLEDKLKDEEWGEKVVEIVEGAVDKTSPESVERNLLENLNVHLEDDGVIDILLNALANNNPNIYKGLGLEVPPRSKELLEKLCRKHGLTVKRSVKEYFGPNDWRYLNSEARQGDKYQGTRLHTNILKWSGEKSVITSGLPDVIKFADHFIRNLDSKFEKFNSQEAQIMLQKLQDMKDHIETLEKKLSDCVSEEG